MNKLSNAGGIKIRDVRLSQKPILQVVCVCIHFGVGMGKKEESGAAEFGTDEYGQEILLNRGFQMMMEWERPYMQACIDNIKPTGDVLEVGFGLGYSSTQIQAHHPKSHTIIECDPKVANEARAWAKQYKNVTIVEDTWQNALDTLGKFDAIFFDDFPLLDPETIRIAKRRAQQENAMRKQVDDVESLIKTVQKEMERFKDVKFSDTDLETFAKNYLSRDDIPPEEISQFIENLAEQGNISSKQKDTFLKEMKSSLITKKEKLEKGKKQLEAKVKEANLVLKNLQKEFERFKTMNFSDEDLKAFIQEFFHKKNIPAEQLIHFLNRIEKGGNINQEQKTRIIEELKGSKEEKASQKSQENLQKQADSIEEKMEEVHYLRAALQEEYTQLTQSLTFSDQQVMEFIEEMKKREDIQPDQVTQFFNQMQNAGNITRSQAETAIKEYLAHTEIKEQSSKDRCVVFFEKCLNSHLHPKGKMSAYMDNPKSKYDYPLFKKKIIERDDVIYKEILMPVDVPPNCTYYSYNQALVMAIEKK